MAMDPALQLTLRLALAALLLWAAAHKLRDRDGFRSALAGYQLLPARVLGAATLGVIVAEAGIAAALAVSGHVVVAGCATAGLFALYAGAIAINLGRGRREIDCGCGGIAGDQPLSTALVWRNVGLVVCALLTIVPCASRQLIWMDAVTIGAAISVLAMIYAVVDGLLANAPKIAALAKVRLADEGRHA